MTWISVKEELPPKHPILTTDGQQQHVAYYVEDRDGYCTGAGESCNYCCGRPSCDYVPNHWYNYIFTHWMILPEMPVKE